MFAFQAGRGGGVDKYHLGLKVLEYCLAKLIHLTRRAVISLYIFTSRQNWLSGEKAFYIYIYIYIYIHKEKALINQYKKN